MLTVYPSVLDHNFVFTILNFEKDRSSEQLVMGTVKNNIGIFKNVLKIV